MELNKDQIAELRAYRNKPDEDDIRYKEIIKKMLIENDKIIYLLHNEELEAEDVDNDEYLTQNILSHYMITPTQTSVQNYICFETLFQEISRSNSIIK